MFSLKTKFSILKALLFKRKAPYYIQYYINGRCHLKCKQCNIVETNSNVKEASLEEIEIIGKNIADIGGGVVLLTGGEPFLRKDIHLIVKTLKKNNLDVRLQTAGIATTEQLELCYKEGARDLNISLDSLDSNKQDYINSVPNSWDAAIDAISRVSNVFSDESAICSLGCVLSKFNFREIPAILEFATKIGWYLSLVPVHITTQEEFMGFRSYDNTFLFEEGDFEELEKVIKKLIEMKSQGYNLFDSESYLWSSYNFLKTGKETWRKKGVCDSPDLYFAIRPNGEFTTCCDYTLEETKSLADPNFSKYYKEGVLHKLSDPYVKNCSGCHYGSYPEVTISVRDPKAFIERVKLVLTQGKGKVKSLPKIEYYNIINELKEKYKDVYEGQPHMSNVLIKWKDPSSRKELIKQDNEVRKNQNRLRLRPKDDL